MSKTPTIHVGIMSSNRVDFTLEEKYRLEGNNQVFEGNQTAKIKNGKVKLSNSSVFEKELHFSPVDFNVSEFELKDVTIGVEFHWEQKENLKFQGDLKLIIEEDRITAINILPLENYLISVISSEMSANSSLELLKAHAIISRSWLIAQFEKQDKLSLEAKSYESTLKTEDEFIRWYDREDHLNYHVCADDHCQRYQGTTRAHHPNVVLAVNETAGIILSYNRLVCDARYSKCCGGIAELFENCWEPINHPYLTAVIDNPKAPDGFNTDLTVEENSTAWINNCPEAFCNTTDEEVLSQVLNDYDQTAKDFYRWSIEYGQDELSALILKRSGNDFGQIIDMVPVERGASGRLIKLKIIGKKKSLTFGKELEIRRWLSESHLYSSAITIEKKDVIEGVPGKFILHGAGWGHGVGLCQVGAAVMGHKGYTYEDILHHYFKNITLEKKY